MTRRAQAVGRCVAVLVLLATVGCVGWRQEGEQDRAVNSVYLESYTRHAIENGVIAQHTLYPYHFVADSTKLTQVGERDLKILAEHFAQAPGSLNMPEKGSSAELHRARVEAVRTRLAEQGVDLARVAIVDEMPGGPGMSSERVIQALQSEQGDRQPTRKPASSPTSKMPTGPKQPTQSSAQ